MSATRRFYLVAIESETEIHAEEIDLAISLSAFEDLVTYSRVIPVDRITAVVGSIWAGVPVADVIGEPKP